jgi:hypothetical protein
MENGWGDAPLPHSHGEASEAGYDGSLDASNRSNSVHDSQIGLLEIIKQNWLFLVFVACLTCWLVISRYLRAQEQRRNEARRVAIVEAARRKYLEKLEQEAEEFKKTAEFEELEKASRVRDSGILPEHRHTTLKATMPLSSTRPDTSSHRPSWAQRKNPCAGGG